MLTRTPTLELPEVDIVVIGASAGAVDALSVLLPAVPADARVPVVVVVHVPAKSPSLLASLFSSKCSASVREPDDKELVGRGVWFAPPGYHLLVERDRSFAFSVDDPVKFSRPSIDVLFESVAMTYGARCAAFVLTGASSDGADGARAIRDAGGFVAVQEPASAEYRTMPECAVVRARPQMVASLSELGRVLSRLVTPSAGEGE
jgi:two-component system chemotaxis response regulator CheB